MQAAEQNLNWDFIRHTLAPCGVTVILVANAPSERFWKSPRYARDVGDVLMRTGIGRFDSSKFHPFIWNFFHCQTSQIKKAIELIRDAIRVRGLSVDSQIAYADVEKQTWTPVEN